MSNDRLLKAEEAVLKALAVIQRGSGWEITQEIEKQSNGNLLGFGVLYGALYSLERQQKIESWWEEWDGHTERRRVYRLH